MIELHFSPTDVETLDHERYHHPHPRVQRKMEALYLKSQDLPHHQIAHLTGVCGNTLRSYFREYGQGGIERLKQVNFHQPESALKTHQTSLEAYFREHPPATINEAVQQIEELTGIQRSPTQVRQFLNAMGMKRRKVGMVPAQAADEAHQKVQESFLEEQLQPRLEQAQAGKRAVFFVDAAHFVWAPFLGFLWCFTRLFVKAASGRRRFNVLGALNAITHELVTITNDSYINAQSVCQLLRQLAQLNLGIPITLVLDNARYQKCKLVAQLAQTLNIELLYLPAYSPNLNLIERLWKFVKKECLYSKYYDQFGGFKQAIQQCLTQTHTTHKNALDSLLALKFQTFQKAQFLPV